MIYYQINTQFSLQKKKNVSGIFTPNAQSFSSTQTIKNHQSQTNDKKFRIFSITPKQNQQQHKQTHTKTQMQIEKKEKLRESTHIPAMIPNCFSKSPIYNFNIF